MAWILPLAQIALPLIQQMTQQQRAPAAPTAPASTGLRQALAGTGAPGVSAVTPEGTVVQLASSDLAPLAQHQAAVGRAQVSQIAGALDPALQEIRGLLAQRALQIQATTESRELAAREAYRREVIGRLQAIQAAVGSRPAPGSRY